jgi:hypothetical protein
MTKIFLPTVLFLSLMLVSQNSNSLPWTMPGFLQRLEISDLVASGTIESSTPLGVRTVDGIRLDANTAHLRVDRVFQGKTAGEIQFAWFTIPMNNVAYSGPPIANLRPHKRYLVFLKRESSGWVAAMPVYALEFELAPEVLKGSHRDLSEVPAEQRYEAIAEELEKAALLVPMPSPGLSGEAASYFSPVFDLIGGCAEPFYRRFLSSPSHELRDAALSWLQLISSRRMTCSSPVVASQ